MTTTPTTEPEATGLLTRSGAAAWLAIHARTLDRLTARGELPAVEIGRRVLYRREALEAFVRSRESRRGA